MSLDVVLICIMELITLEASSPICLTFDQKTYTWPLHVARASHRMVTGFLRQLWKGEHPDSEDSRSSRKALQGFFSSILGSHTDTVVVMFGKFSPSHPINWARYVWENRKSTLIGSQCSLGKLFLLLSQKLYSREGRSFDPVIGALEIYCRVMGCGVSKPWDHLVSLFFCIHCTDSRER